MGKAAKKTTTKTKGDGIDKEKQRQQNDEEDREKAENLRKAREEEAAEAAEAAMLREQQENLRNATTAMEKQKRNSKFGNLMFLVIEFPKGGDFWFHKYGKFLHSISLAPPCLIKGVYANIDNKRGRDPDIGNKMELIYKGIDKTSFVPLAKYDKDLRDFLEYFMVNMGEPAKYAKGDKEWFIAFYWRMQWVKHGLCHFIAEMDYYWKIYSLYQKASIDDFLYYWWSHKVGYYKAGYYGEVSTVPCTDEIIVMTCRGSTLSNGIRNCTNHRPAIYSNSYTNGLSKIYIGFDGDENIVNVPFHFGSNGFWNLDLYV